LRKQLQQLLLWQQAPQVQTEPGSRMVCQPLLALLLL
jgi:hypothetical protein